MRRHRWWPRRTRKDGAGLLVYAVGSPAPMTLRVRLLTRYRIWRARRKSIERRRMGDLPRFYQRARQSDVDGLVINGGSWTVGDFLPVGFEAYLRLPNPFWKIVPESTAGAILHRSDSSDNSEDTWAKPVACSEVAATNGLRMTHDTAWSHICGPHDRYLPKSPEQDWSWAPSEGDLDPVTAERLFPLLASETDPKDRCLCGQWEGGSSDWDTEVLLNTRWWNYFIWRTQFRDVTDWLRRPDSFERGLHVPHVIWPADRRWFLATLYSGHSNYLAGSRTLIDTVRASELEAYEVALTDRAH